jgi:type II secretory pathway component PulF
MPLYHYDSFNRQGKRVKGTLDASSPQAVKEVLQGQGLMPTTIQELSGAKAGFSFKTLFEPRVDTATVILFTKQLAVLLKSAIPLLQALELLVEQFEGRFKRIIITVKDGVKGGEGFAKELSRYPDVFSNVYIQLVRAGEASGKLDTILMRLTDYMQRREETKKRIKKAMMMPIIQLSAALLVVVGLLMWMVPMMQGLFEQLKLKLPLPTRILGFISAFINHNITELAIVIGLGAGIFFYWKSTPSGKYKIDEIFLRLPFTSFFSRTKAVVQFSKTLGMLLESGVNLSEALDIVCNIVENKVLTVKLNQARDKIIKEGKIAKYLKETGIFPSIASYMLSTGEQSGKLAEMLLTVGEDYEVQLQDLTDAITASITPVMTLFMVLIIGFIMAAVFLPIFDMGSLLQL